MTAVCEVDEEDEEEDARVDSATGRREGRQCKNARGQYERTSRKCERYSTAIERMKAMILAGVDSSVQAGTRIILVYSRC